MRELILPEAAAKGMLDVCRNGPSNRYAILGLTVLDSLHGGKNSGSLESSYEPVRIVRRNRNLPLMPGRYNLDGHISSGNRS